MLQVIIQGGLELLETHNSLPLGGVVLGALAYLPLPLGLGTLTEALGLAGWVPEDLPESEVRWEFWPVEPLPLPGGPVIVRPALLVTSPGRVLAVEVSWMEQGDALAERLARVRAVAQRRAARQGEGARAEAGLVGVQFGNPLPGGRGRWTSLDELQRRLAARAAARPSLTRGLRRLVDDLGELLRARAAGGPPGMIGLPPADPPLSDPAPLESWQVEARWEGWGALPPGPGSVLLPWNPAGNPG